MSVAGSLRKEALPPAQQDRIDGQQDFIRKPMFEQRIAASTGTIGVREAVLQLEPAGGARAIALLRPRLPGATLDAVVLQPNQRVRLNLAGLTMQGVPFTRP